MTSSTILTKTFPVDDADPLTAGIIRDARYVDTLKRDLRRQKIRRGVHWLSALWERAVSIPRWERLSLETPAPRLSVIIPTMNASARLVPLLHFARRFADEIIVGVDSKTTDDTFDLATPLADRCFVIENAARHCNGILDQLVAKCSGDWILRLDDDEWPEPDFVRLKNGILRDADRRGVTHFKIARPHVCHLEEFPDVSGALQSNQEETLYWIPDGYLFPDYQLRLFKNAPELLAFPPALPHVNLSVKGKQGKLHSVRLLHLNLAVYPKADRLAKLRRNIDRHEGGWVHPVNEAALLWERFNYRVLPYTSHDTAFDTTVSTVIADSLAHATRSIL